MLIKKWFTIFKITQNTLRYFSLAKVWLMGAPEDGCFGGAEQVRRDQGGLGDGL
jgi:hypothetical protein